MSAQVIDGRGAARDLKSLLVADLTQLRELGHDIGLATVIVGAPYEALAYERRLQRLAAQTGVDYRSHALAADASQDEVVERIVALNDDPAVSGILILRPLPAHIDEATVFRAVHPEKDIEALHPDNAGLLALGVPRFVPSTAASVFHLLDGWLDATGTDRAEFYHHASIVVVGRSNNVGKPCISLGYARQATVTSVDEWADRTGGLGRRTRSADVLIVAAGKPGLIRAEHVSPGAVVLDVGINPRRQADGKLHMVGDVDYDSVAPRVRAITPVPGGVGPVTDVWLLRNTVLARSLQAGLAVESALVGARV